MDGEIRGHPVKAARARSKRPGALLRELTAERSEHRGDRAPGQLRLRTITERVFILVGEILGHFASITRDHDVAVHGIREAILLARCALETSQCLELLRVQLGSVGAESHGALEEAETVTELEALAVLVPGRIRHVHGSGG